MAKVIFPEKCSASRREIILAFYAVRRRHAVAGSELVRQISRRLGRVIDKNGSNDHVRRIVKEYVQFLSQNPVKGL